MEKMPKMRLVEEGRGYRIVRFRDRRFRDGYRPAVRQDTTLLPIDFAREISRIIGRKAKITVYGEFGGWKG